MDKLLRTLILLFVLVMAACRQPEATPTPSVNLTLDIAYEPAPPVVGAVTLVVTVLDAAGTAVDGATVAVRGDMAHAGMTSMDGQTDESENGVYRIPFEWTMGGDWILTVTVTLPDGTSVVQAFNATIGS
ncbi:MAG: FixH family protein [Chloroflexi bacterium]|nr:FixH family protein [Chloroflexota bacterium]